jgi:hypothetical protein
MYNRREFIKIGGLGVAAYALMNTLEGTEVLTQASVSPRNTASACIFINLAGGPSHLDTFSVKQGPWTPSDWNIDTRNNITLPRRLFPNLLDRASQHLAIAHSVQGWWDASHPPAWYWLETAHDFDPDLVDERPALGTVVGMEYQTRRRPGDSLPGFVSLIGRPQAGSGFLEGPYAPFPILGHVGDQPDRLIAPAGLSLRCDRKLWDERFYDFYEAVCIGRPDVTRIFQYTEAERNAYGGTTFGDACLLARNLIAANQGTRFVYITFNDFVWDHHSDIYPTLRNLAPVLDQGLATLIQQLGSTPSREFPGHSVLDKTLVVAMGEFGRVPPSAYSTGTGLNEANGRDHYANVHFALFAGGGVRGGRNIGVLNADGSAIRDPGWWGAGYSRPAGPNIRMEDIGVTIYSALGINWTTEIKATPSGKVYQYIDGGPDTPYKEIRELFTSTSKSTRRAAFEIPV